MAKHKTPHLQPAQDAPATAPGVMPLKQPWQEPKLTFVEPKLVKHGALQEVTGQFFGGFTPDSSRHS